MPRDYTPLDSTRYCGIVWVEDTHIRHDQQLALVNRRSGSRSRWQSGLASVRRGFIPHARESCRSLQSLQCRAQGTTSRRALLIGCPHSSQVPNLSCRATVLFRKSQSLARTARDRANCITRAGEVMRGTPRTCVLRARRGPNQGMIDNADLTLAPQVVVGTVCASAAPAS